MEGLRLVSRSIVNDRIFDKVQQQRYQRHVQTLDRISCGRSSLHIESCDSTGNLRRIEKSKHAHLHVRKSFNPIEVQNIVLVKKLCKIDQRRLETSEDKPRIIHHKQKLDSSHLENLYLAEKIRKQKASMLTKKDFRKQFRQYEKLRSHSRKIKDIVKENKSKQCYRELRGDRQELRG